MSILNDIVISKFTMKSVLDKELISENNKQSMTESDDRIWAKCGNPISGKNCKEFSIPNNIFE